MKYPYNRGYWKFQKDGTGQFKNFFKGKDPVFLFCTFEIHILW